MSDALQRLTAALDDRYTLERELGAGGMATVYLAEDLKHHRKVAIKVLRPELAAVIGAERFLREITTIASLQHPHILGLIDSGEVDGTAYYVMPFVEGESLRDRLTREKQLSVTDAVRIATEIAGALDYAHRHGVIHRDIKPENVLLHDGSALVADFGIALASKATDGHRITETGFSLGTPRYMSPEQSMGERDITGRSDIFALGCVTYEMLVGDPPFLGSSQQAIRARVMTEKPVPIRLLRERVPPSVEAAVLVALEKLPSDRFASAAQFAAALNAGTPGGDTTATLAMPSGKTHRAVAVAVGLLAILAAWGWLRPRPHDAATTTRVTIAMPSDRLLAGSDKPFDISPDGTEIAYVVESEGQSRLYLRPLNDFEAHPLVGTDGASGPFFSADGRWIGFAAGGILKKVLRTGGAPIELTRFGGTWSGGVWRKDGTIWYATAGAALYRIGEDGGSPTALRLMPSADSTAKEGAIGQVRWPSLLPDGEHAVVSIAHDTIAIVTLANGETRSIRPGRGAQYLPTGHLLYDETEGRMRLAPFDLRTLSITGPAVPAFEAFRSPGGGQAQVAVSATGTLLYVAGGFDRTLVRVDRGGRETALPYPPRGYRFPRISPDGTRLAVTVDPRPSQIWVIDFVRGAAIPVTTGPHSIGAVWSPTGERLAFTQFGTKWAAWPPDHLMHVVLRDQMDSSSIYVQDWTRQHGLLAHRVDTTARSIIAFALGDSLPTRLSPPAVNEWQPAVSHRESLLAYVSNITGADEVYVRPVGGGEAGQVSVGGGVEPRWSADDQMLYYRRGSHIMAASLRADSPFRVLGAPHDVLSGSYDFSQDRNWDVAPDGSIILIRGDPASIG
ncbi:MAG: protein kinase, partial [Gemmatimonadota bacterium]